jgi:hypothetical protein
LGFEISNFKPFILSIPINFSSQGTAKKKDAPSVEGASFSFAVGKVPVRRGAARSFVEAERRRPKLHAHG